MTHQTAAPSATTVLVVKRGVTFAVGGHCCDTWAWKQAGYQCDHGFVMWQSQVVEARYAASGQDDSR
ncbi:hypothetical protein NQK81_02050 [Amycolatopsis roodepoortensis]|uniref:hypothetical protein n=1 Tax=Amycolatopsis roodepoortensis TaxID=700274 RepID=UPI00214B1B94|nr:hypothetical protein [Amycolatopsis roodepoortensis]UUV32257.1 hypothetical protein NQK81_02050 [Amycolatopsis roodepoortensis]